MPSDPHIEFDRINLSAFGRVPNRRSMSRYNSLRARIEEKLCAFCGRLPKDTKWHCQ